MKRRGYLAVCAAVASGSVAGCSDLRQVEDGNSDAIPGYDTSELRDADVGVGEASRVDGDAIIEYTTTRTGDEARSQVGIVATAIADAISDPDAFEVAISTIRVTGSDADGEEVIRFSIRASDAVAYHEGDFGEDEYLERVRESVQLEE